MPCVHSIGVKSWPLTVEFTFYTGLLTYYFVVFLPDEVLVNTEDMKAVSHELREKIHSKIRAWARTDQPTRDQELLVGNPVCVVCLLSSAALLGSVLYAGLSLFGIANSAL